MTERAAMSDAGVMAAGKLPVLLDVARGLAMVVVLYGHALEVFFLDRPDKRFAEAAFAQYKLLAAFAMPLFFLVSGAASARLPRKGWRNVLRTSLYLVALAYLVHWLGVAGLLFETLLSGDEDYILNLTLGLEAGLKGRNFSTIVVWFLVSLAVVRLIAYLLFSRMPRQRAMLAVAAIGLASVLMPVLPNAFMMKTWFAGTVFFALGMVLAPWLGRPGGRMALVLLPATALLASFNRGCAFDPDGRCGLPGLAGEAVVWLHIGEVGFVPLFYLAAIAGCAMALGLANALIRLGVADLLARIGKRSLELLVINGFVLVFLQPALKPIALDEPDLWLYPPLLVLVVAFHLLMLRLLARPLAALNRLAARLADMLMTLLPRPPGPSRGEDVPKSA